MKGSTENAYSQFESKMKKWKVAGEVSETREKREKELVSSVTL